MNYEKVIHDLSNYIAGELNLSNKDQDRIRFGLEIVISQFISFFSALILAYILGIIKYVLIVLFISGVMKVVAGGIHFKTVLECAFFTTFLTNLFGLIAYWINISFSYTWIAFFISIVIIILSLLVWSPAEVENKPLKDDKKRRKFKFLSIIMASFFLILLFILLKINQFEFNILNASILSGLFLHTFSINPLTYKLTSFYYKLKNMVL